MLGLDGDEGWLPAILETPNYPSDAVGTVFSVIAFWSKLGMVPGTEQWRDSGSHELRGIICEVAGVPKRTRGRVSLPLVDKPLLRCRKRIKNPKETHKHWKERILRTEPFCKIFLKFLLPFFFSRIPSISAKNPSLFPHKLGWSPCYECQGKDEKIHRLIQELNNMQTERDEARRELERRLGLETVSGCFRDFFCKKIMWNFQLMNKFVWFYFVFSDSLYSSLFQSLEGFRSSE